MIRPRKPSDLIPELQGRFPIRVELGREELCPPEVREVPRLMRDHFDADPPEERPDETERSLHRPGTILVWRPR